MRWARVALVPTSFAAALALVVAPTVSAHRLSAQGAPDVCVYPPCADTHLEGHYTNGGVPGVDADYSFFDTSVDSDNGHSSIDEGWSWLEGATPPHSNEVSAVIEENVDLVRIAPGPIVVRATLVLDFAAQFTGSVGLQASALVSFNGCQVYVQQTFFNAYPTDTVLTGDCGAQSTAAALVVTQIYDGQPPTHPLLRTQLQAGYLSASKGDSIAAQLASDLHFEVSNATTTWDTPTFLTQAPEPEGDALAIVAIGAIAASGRRRSAVARPSR
jgi:hypothetical protein